MSDASPRTQGRGNVDEVLSIEHAARIDLDQDGVIVGIDDTARALLGDPRAALGQPLADLAIEAYRPALRTLLDRVQPGGPALRAELGLRCGDGQELRAAVIAVAPDPPAPSPSPSHATVFLRDLSNQRSTDRILGATQAVARAMARAQSPARAVESLLASLGSSMGWEVGGYWTLLPDDATLELTVTWSGGGIDAGAALPRRFALAGSLAERSFTAGEARWTVDLAADTELATATIAGETGLHGAVAVPTARAGRPTGVIGFLSSRPRAADASILDALSVAGTQLGELLGMLQERLDAVESLRRLALTDELTGVPNRRAWEEAVRRELARAVRDRHPVCIAVLDLDDFKRFNDEHGHQAGDRVLSESARAWQAQLRGSDLLARYGGEEFAALIPAWPLDAAVEVVERLRQATAGGLTASAGVASWDGTETGEELFGRADAALYEAKQSGRDRTVAAR